LHADFVLISYAAVFVFSIITIIFLKFHIKIILNNSTTIKLLDTDHKNYNEKFNLRFRQNLEQILGVNLYFCFFLFLPKEENLTGMV